MSTNKDFRNQIQESLKEARPNLSSASLATYTSMLNTLAKNMEANTMAQLKDLNEEKVMEYVETKSNMSSKKTLLSALVLITNNDTYRQRMIQYSNDVNANYRKQTVDPEKEDDYLTPNQVKERFEEAKTDLKNSPSPNNYVVYLVCALMSGVTIQPRRLEWANVKVKNFNVKTDNYLDLKTNTFHFNQYKTFSTYGHQKVTAPKDVMIVIRRWLKINDSDYLLVSKTGKKLSASALSTLIGVIYRNQKVGISSLRKTHNSDKYKDIPAVQQMIDDATAMGHSLTTALTVYTKKNIKRDKK